MQTAEKEILEGIVGRVWGPDAADWGDWAEHDGVNSLRGSSQTKLSERWDNEKENVNHNQGDDPGLRVHLSAPSGPAVVPSSPLIDDPKIYISKLKPKTSGKTSLPVLKVVIIHANHRLVTVMTDFLAGKFHV